VRWRRRTSL
jgi:Inactive homolog of metal-dependent proteases, putative molecular chaperone